MTVLYNLDQLENKQLRNPVLTIGNFDGVHKGHLSLFNKVKERAALIDGQSVVMTFEPHPIKVMMPEDAYLARKATRSARLLSRARPPEEACSSFFFPTPP